MCFLCAVLLEHEVNLQSPSTITSNSVKICDFGSARLLSETHRQSSQTVSWLSPEAIRYGRYSTSSDVWRYVAVILSYTSGMVDVR